jgi:hypothetical protein
MSRDGQDPSRRDLFRLFRRKDEASQTAPPRPRIKLPVLEHTRPEMPAPAAADERPMRAHELPELGDSLVDPRTLEQLFFDLEHATELVSVTVKERGARRSSAVAVTLTHAHERLLAGDVAGIQVRYRHAGGEWWDTLMRVPGGVRIIRIRHEL